MKDKENIYFQTRVFKFGGSSMEGMKKTQQFSSISLKLCQIRQKKTQGHGCE